MEIIDLGKPTPQWNIDYILQEAFKPQQQLLNQSSCIKINYQQLNNSLNMSTKAFNMPNNQFFIPNNQFQMPNNPFQRPTNIDFFINTAIIQPDLMPQKILLFSKQNIKNIMISGEDFYFENLDHANSLFKLFLNFLYTGKIYYRIREDFLPLLKIAIYFQYEILINQLIKQVKPQGILRNFFLTFIIDIFQDQSYFQVLLNNQDENALKFLDQIVLENAPIIISHKEWHRFNKKEAQDKIQNAFKQVSVKLFEEIAKILTKFQQQKIIYLTSFLHFIDKYKNPLVEIMEDIYLGRVFQFVDEQFIQQNSEWLTNRCQRLLQETIQKIENPPFHMQHSKICDLVNKSFQATCSHQICLNCFYQYLLYRSKFKQYNQNNPQKIRCFARFIDLDLCDCCFQDQDFLQLREYQADDLLNLYLKEKI